MSPLVQLAILALIMAVLMCIGWLWQRRNQNAGIVDVLWSAGLGVGAVLIAATGTGAFAPRLTLAILAASWAARLARHLWRRLSDGQEDGRYRQLRTRWQGDQGKFFAFFQLQAGLVVLFALPFVAVASSPVNRLTPTLLLAIAIWTISFIGESIADRQLTRFRREPSHQGRTCREGLWRYSRHPNYFFEWIHWFVYVALAYGSPIAWLAYSGPVLMYVLLRWISGIPYTEAQALRSRAGDYREYQRSTSMLFPWFPKSASPSDATCKE